MYAGQSNQTVHRSKMQKQKKALGAEEWNHNYIVPNCITYIIYKV